jgi:NitT/TauT family transport system substrate-binding protein
MEKRYSKALIVLGLVMVMIAAGGMISQSRAKEKDVLNISLDQWIGWRSILMANGGLNTKKGSIFDKLGLTLNIKNIDDNDTKLNALIARHVDAMGSTIQRYSFEFPKLQRAKVLVKMIFITNTSSGGDGIISRKNIMSIEDLAGKKVALARFTEAQCLLEWAMMNSLLTPQQIEKVREDIVFTEDAGKAGEIFFGKHADAAATWQPFLSQAQSTPDAHILLDTKAINNFIIDGIIFREDYLKAHPSAVSKFIQGTLEATDALLATPPRETDPEYSYLVNSFPMCANLKKEEIEGMFPDAALSDYADNLRYLEKKGLSEKVFMVSSRIWKGLGETAEPELAKVAFDSSWLKAAEKSVPKKEKPKFMVTAEQRAKTQAEAPIFKKTWSINFSKGSADILPERQGQLYDFVILANMAEKTVIQVEGNTDNVEGGNMSQDLSEKRAKAVAQYLQGKGIEPTRFIVVGNGVQKPIASNDDEAGQARNRRVDLLLKAIK